MDATQNITEWKRRLIALAGNPDDASRNTPQYLKLIEHNARWRSTFAGYSEAEVARAEIKLGVQFPAVFREYLREMARGHGELFCGSDLAGIDELEQYRADALALLAETDPTLTLPPGAVVFLSHQGYTFLYLVAAGGFDSPVMQWIERDPAPGQVAVGFAELVDAELRLMERLAQNQPGTPDASGSK